MVRVHCLQPKIGFGSNCYLVEHSGRFAVVDPSVSFEELTAAYPDALDKIDAVLVTHAHFDHILAINSYAQKEIEIYVGEQDGTSLSDSYYNCYLGFLGIEDGYYGQYVGLKDGDTVKLAGADITVRDCPGHTKGAVYYRTHDCVFVGDTLFAGGGFGRTDLPGGDFDTLEKSLIKIITHENDCVFYPGHGEPTELRQAIRDFSKN